MSRGENCGGGQSSRMGILSIALSISLSILSSEPLDCCGTHRQCRGPQQFNGSDERIEKEIEKAMERIHLPKFIGLPVFGSEEQRTQPPPSKTVPPPPYGVDIGTEKHPDGGAPPTNQNVSNRSSHPRVQGHHLGNLVTNRPSTKVKSVPGGDSSLGYLFEDK